MTILHQIGDSLLLSVPLAWVRGLFFASLFILFLWVMRLPRSETSPPREATRWDENLKLWAGMTLAIQIAIYSLL